MRTKITALIIVISLHAFADEPTNRIRDAVTAINRSPSWLEMTSESIREHGPEFLRTLEGFREWDVEDVRKVIVLLLKENSGFSDRLSTSSKIFILNRFYFAVPTNIPIEDYRPFSGWVVPSAKGAVNSLFPLTMKGDQFTIDAVCPIYTGQAPRMEEEFDYFASVYGPRFKEKQQ